MHSSSTARRRGVFGVGVAITLLVSLASGPALAQQKSTSAQGKPKPAAAAPAPAQDPKLVEAERLFVEAKRLMNEMRVSEACRAFEESQKLDPAVGTQFNIADCLEREGRIATAYRQFSDLHDVLARVGDDRAPQAEARARALEPKLPRITIRIPWSKSVSGLVVMRDGETVEHSMLGTSVPVDPGAHKIVVQATNKKDYAVTVNAALGKADVVDVPALADVERQVVVRNTGVSQRNIGLVVAGVGVAAVGTSVVLGFVAKGNYDGAVEGCTDLGDRYQCPPGNRSGDAASAQSMGTVATIVGGIGAVAIVTGGVLWFTAPKGAKTPEKQSARIDVVPVFDTQRAGLMLSGTL
ncbi:hypothetical protein AKJ09_11464 [Labilithrix luteola]|uniref:PEGA domain-containing protein n=1 Tax=Labilithrix luteola TaxID=1391654 RepID=A0A0K1QGB1_9BACT|nr:hypothetical protein [Labilithrix luteola]AKV04801.1 hypothetical protein AKJ09_11464 [Labilithrix luteola]